MSDLTEMMKGLPGMSGEIDVYYLSVAFHFRTTDAVNVTANRENVLQRINALQS